MVDVYSDPLREIRIVKRWALAAIMAAIGAMVPGYGFFLSVPVVKLAILLAPAAALGVFAIEVASRWEYRMRRRYAYPLRLGYDLATIHDFREACQRSAQLVAQWLNVDAVVVAWLTEDGRDLAPVAAHGQPEDWVETAPSIAIGVRSLTETLQRGLLLTKPSAGGDPWFGDSPAGTRVVYVPLAARDRPQGVLAVAAGPRSVEARDRRLLVALGMVMGLALDNCRLYEGQRAHARHLQELNRMKSDFLSTVSHELRTPLTSIRMAAEMLLEEEEAADPNGPRVRLVQNVVKGAARLSSLVADLVNVSREDAFLPRLELDTVPLADIVASATAIIQPLMAAKNQTLGVQLAQSGTAVLVDRLRFEQVLINLLSNAQRYTPDGGCILVSSRLEKGEVIISVTDSGPGVPTQDRELIFEPFFRGDRSGLGLGLAIAKSLVELHNGRIWVESADGQGSTFCVALPRQKLSRSGAAAGAVAG